MHADALPETSEDVALKHLLRYLEATQRLQRLHHSHLSTFLSPVHSKHTGGPQLDEKTHELLKVLADKLRQQKTKTWAHHHRPIIDDDPMLQITKQEAGSYLLPYHLASDHVDYPEEKQPNENDERFAKDLGYGQAYDVDGGIVEEPVLHSFHSKHNHAMGMLHHEGGSETAPVQSASTGKSEFTYKFDNSNLGERHPFAVKPNDPRYYSNAPFSSGKSSLFHLSLLLSLACVQ